MNWIYYQIQPYLPGPPKPKWVTTRILTLILLCSRNAPILHLISLLSRQKGRNSKPQNRFLYFLLSSIRSSSFTIYTNRESYCSGDCSSFLRLSCKVLSNLEGRQLYSHQRFCWIMVCLCTRLSKDLESSSSHSPWLIMLGSAMVKLFVLKLQYSSIGLRVDAVDN